MKKNRLLLTALCLTGLTASAFGLAACGEDTPKHSEHSYSSEWTKTDDGHYRACTGEGCTEKADEAAHSYGEWQVVTAPTAESKGKDKRSCTVCNYEQFRDTDKLTPPPPAAHTHNWGAWTVSLTPTATTAGKATRTCGGTGECDAAEADKEYGLPVLTSTDYTKSADSATCSAKGKITYTYNKNNVSVSFDAATEINPEAHDYGNYTYTDGTGHYKVCSHNAGHKTASEPHDTDGTDGACSVCGYKAAVTPEHSHTKGEWVNTDSAQHYKLCTDSNCPTPNEKLDAAEHDTDGTDGACSVCGYKAAVTPEHTHTWGDWVVTQKPTRVAPGTAAKKCTDSTCEEYDTDNQINLPPLASESEYTITEDTSTCTAAGTAKYTYKENTAVSFTVDTAAKGHTYGETQLVEGVPKKVCSVCGDAVATELSGSIDPSTEKATFYAGGNLKYTLSAYSGAPGYYTFTYEGEKAIKIEYSYNSLKDGLIEGEVTLSADGQTMIIIYLESRATCTMKITSAEETAFAEEITLSFSETDPSYVTPELSVGLTTVSATYEGVIYEFVATVSGSYSLTFDDAKAVIMTGSVGGDESVLKSPYAFELEAGEKISFVMCCNEETAEYDVQVDLKLTGKGTYADPYVITEDMLATNIGIHIAKGETQYYKLNLHGNYLLNCLPMESKGSYPEFISDDYTATVYTSEIVIAEQKITVEGWQVANITCGDDGFVFAVKGSSNDAGDNVSFYVNAVYGSEANPANWVWYYFFYDTAKSFDVGDTIYVDFLARETGKVTINSFNLASVKYDGKVVSTDNSSFEMDIVEGETYKFECVIAKNVDAGYYHIETKDKVTTVKRTSELADTYIETGDILLWFNFTEGDEQNPHKLNGEGSFELFANDDTYFAVEKSGYYTFTIPAGVTATLNGETAIVSGTQYKLVAEDIIALSNTGEKVTLTYTFVASTGDITNPLMVAESEDSSFTVERGATYYVKADGASDIVLTFDGVTVTHNDTAVSSGVKFGLADEELIVIVNDGSTEITVSYVTTPVIGSVNNPKPIDVTAVENVTAETYFTLTISGDKKYSIKMTNPVSAMVEGHVVSGMVLKPSEEVYAIFGMIVEYDGAYYAFDADGILGGTKGGKYASAVAIGDAKSADGNAYVAHNEFVPLALGAGTHTLHILKNNGTSSVLENMEIGCTLTVVDEVKPKAVYYTVTFSTGKTGLTVEPQTVEKGQTATEEILTCDGYEFDGWFTDVSYNNKFDFNTAITKDIKLFAKWTKIQAEGMEAYPYTAVAGVNSGSVTRDDFNASFGAPIKYYKYVAAKDGDIKISIDGNYIVAASKISFADAIDENNPYFSMVGQESSGIYPSFTITVNKGDTLYIVAGTDATQGGDYSFTMDCGNETAGSGTEADPYIATAGLNSGNVTMDDQNNNFGAPIKYYKYVAANDGDITISIEGGKYIVAASKISYADAIDENNPYFSMVGQESSGIEPSFTITVSEGDTLYIVAGTELPLVGDFSFNMSVN